MKEILCAKSAGFCYGVRRAVEAAKRAAAEPISYLMLGPVIHNTQVIRDLERRGLSCVGAPEEIPEGAGAIIRSHGVGRPVYEALERRGVPIIDATCPNVSKIHRLAAEAEKRNRQVIIIGVPTHPEVAAVAAWCRAPLVFEKPEEVAAYLTAHPALHQMPITILSQTTLTRSIWNSCLGILKKECTNTEIFDTICSATYIRQTESRKIAAQCEAMVVIGDKKSSNTQRLAELCCEVCPLVLRIETADDLDMSLLAEARVVGVTAGASTPAWIIKEVCKKMNDEFMDNVLSETAPSIVEAPTETAPATPAETPAAEESAPAEAADAGEKEESFAELLEQSIKTLYTGQKVTGVVTGISPTEVYVDLGAKQAGYIPVSELSDDPSAEVSSIVQVGDSIETYVMRVNDVEGVVTLSKKRLDAAKNWEDLEAAREEKRIVEGVVTEENKGGVVVSVRGIRVFVPASQTGLPREAAMSELVKKKVRLRITEVNRSRRGVMGSIRAVQLEERKAMGEKIWNEIEPGMRYSGVVKSLTSYGAFVDIGGVDGMVHISELSWNRIKHPSQVVSVGDQVEVYVISADKEKKKISLGMKDQAEDPWTKFMNTYAVGSIVNVKIVKLMSFGAFAEILPGVDGLIHISQIATRRIEKPGDVLSEGQNADVKIIAIDPEKHKVSLSIRAVLTDADALQYIKDRDLNASFEEAINAEPAEAEEPAEAPAEE